MSNALQSSLLRDVSRSFFLTIRLLPKDFRDPIALAYLLARASDTLADTPNIPTHLKTHSLREFQTAINQTGIAPSWNTKLAQGESPSEAKLLAHTQKILDHLAQLPISQAKLIRNVVNTIISGQMFDLEWFKTGTPEHPKALENSTMLDEYTYRVAGCVGEFWTDLGFHLRGTDFSDLPQDTLRVWGCIYGQGLQLVNILRDGEKDRLNGRCYLPLKNPNSPNEWLSQYHKWHHVAIQSVRLGIRYSRTLHGRRIRAATTLPAYLGLDTLKLIKNCSRSELSTTPKISRGTVYKRLLQSFIL